MVLIVHVVFNRLESKHITNAMDFALKILNKYGWKEGEGLGKKSNGIAKPLRATLKFDNAGFGADQAATDFNNHWWERVFNDAASNVAVKQEGETIKMDLKDDEDGVEISTKGYSMKKLKKAKQHREKETPNGYDNFLKAATLTNMGGEVENPDRIEAGDIEVTKIKVLTDDELFKACGGRTAHKGARHGLKLSGKLLRIEQQEKDLLAKMIAKRNATEEANNFSKKIKETKLEKSNNKDQELQEPKNKKKKSGRSDDLKATGDSSLTEENQILETQTIKLKKKKKKLELDDSMGKNVNEVNIEPSFTATIKTKKNKDKEEPEQSVEIVEHIEKKIKKKAKQRCSLKEEETQLEDLDEVEYLNQTKKAKKQKVEVLLKEESQEKKTMEEARSEKCYEVVDSIEMETKKKRKKNKEVTPQMDESYNENVHKKRKSKNKCQNIELD